MVVNIVEKHYMMFWNLMCAKPFSLKIRKKKKKSSVGKFVVWGVVVFVVIACCGGGYLYRVISKAKEKASQENIQKKIAEAQKLAANGGTAFDEANVSVTAEASQEETQTAESVQAEVKITVSQFMQEISNFQQLYVGNKAKFMSEWKKNSHTLKPANEEEMAVYRNMMQRYIEENEKAGKILPAINAMYISTHCTQFHLPVAECYPSSAPIQVDFLLSFAP